MTFKLRVHVYHFWPKNFACYEESTGSPVQGLFFVLLKCSWEFFVKVNIGYTRGDQKVLGLT